MNEEYIILLIVLLGLIIGSFLNTLIYRIPLILKLKSSPISSISLSNPRSFCTNCLSKIPFYFNIPLLSYIVLRGKCVNCKSKISILYPLIEFITAFSFLLLYLLYGLTYEVLFYAIAISILIPISLIDLKFKIIPNNLSTSLLLLGICYSFVASSISVIDSLLGIVLGFSVLYFINFIYEKINKETGIGVGDAKLLAGIGSILGYKLLPLVLLLTSFIGIVLGMIYYLKETNRVSFFKTSIPLAPSLSLSFLFSILVN